MLLNEYFKLLVFLEEEHGKLGVAVGTIGSLCLLGLGLGMILAGLGLSIIALNNLFY